MFDIQKTASRFGDDIARRAAPLGRDLVDRARPYGEDLVARAEGLIRKARPYAEQLSTRADDLYRKAQGRPSAPAPAPEPRSFLSTPTGQAAGAAALGVLAGLAFGVVRKAAVQGTEALAGDWLEVLKAEHRMVDKLLEQLLATTERQKIKRALLLARIGRALAKHDMQEAMVIYPALREASGNGQAMHLYEDHARLKLFIHELQEIAKDDPLWIERARAFQASVQAHVREEEEDVFPGFHDRMSPQQNRRLTLMVHREGLKLA